MKFFFPDSSDMVDPSFDFETEERARPLARSRQFDYNYAHELFSRPPYDGILVSKTVLDVKSNYGTRYTTAQQLRFLRVGVREFFRLDAPGGDAHLEAMGDCGAFSYVREAEPPFGVGELIEFYEGSGFDCGLSLDHMILGYRAGGGKPLAESEAKEWARRQDLTLTLAEEFSRGHRASGCSFIPVGVAQGWSPDSYAQAVGRLQSMGYGYVAIGGMAGLKTREVLACLERVNAIRRPHVALHLLGVRITRQEGAGLFSRYGVNSFDTTAPLRQAFKDDVDNYYTHERTYTAIRVPQADGTPKLVQTIKAGLLNQDRIRGMERACMQALSLYEAGQIPIGDVLSALRAYEEIYDGIINRTELYREILVDRPWRDCPCDVCRKLGIQVMIFRGAERHKRRGFHNLYITYQKLRREVGRTDGWPSHN
jgi:hypothetical protein